MFYVTVVHLSRSLIYIKGAAKSYEYGSQHMVALDKLARISKDLLDQGTICRAAIDIPLDNCCWI